MSGGFVPELGQYAFSNTPWEAYETPSYVTEGISLLGECLVGFEYDERGGELIASNPVGNVSEWFSNMTFALRSYCWCDGDAEHEKGCPPNFHHYASGFKCYWYKHASRGESSNQMITPHMMSDIFIDCINSLKGTK